MVQARWIHTGLIIPTERRIVPGAKAAAVMHHNCREIVHETVCLQIRTAILAYIQLGSKLHVDRDLSTVTPTRPPDNQSKHLAMK